MKTSFVVLLLFLAILQVQAQKLKSENVPASIRDALSKNYAVTNADWEMVGSGFEASFEQKGKEMSVVFDKQGNVLEAETEINKNELPQAVMDILKKEFAGFNIKEAERIESTGIITYEVEVKKGKESFELIFDDQKIIKKVINESEETN